MRSLLVASVALLLLGSGCASSDDPPDPCATPPTYAADIHPKVIAVRCLACHTERRHEPADRRGAPPELNFDRWELVEPKKREVTDAILSGRQPPVGTAEPVTREERALVSQWRDCGFPP